MRGVENISSFLITSLFAISTRSSPPRAPSPSPTPVTPTSPGFKKQSQDLTHIIGFAMLRLPSVISADDNLCPVEATLFEPDTVTPCKSVRDIVPCLRAQGPLTIAPDTPSSAERCLSLDVFAPINSASSFPLLVEIYGSGYTPGSAQTPRPDYMMC